MRQAARIVLLASSLAAAAHAGSIDTVLGPQDSAVDIRTYGLGLLPLDGRFTRFHGALRYDPADHARCSVALQVDVASLAMGSAAVGETVRGPDFLDAARFPTLSYTGTCDRAGLDGTLTMHGVTRRFVLALDWADGDVTAVGRLRRADWGMTAQRLLGGSTVRITVTVPLPAPAAPDRPGR
jgi:polyisoprenoid-binding protein YceI